MFVYELVRRKWSIEDLVTYLLLLTPIITFFMVCALWFALGAGKIER